MEKVLVFIPDTLDLKKSGYIKGVYKNVGTSQTYYITSDELLSNSTDKCIGYISKNCSKLDNSKNILIYINSSSGKVSFNSEQLSKNHVVEIIYDYNGLKNSEISSSQDWGLHFRTISNYLKENNYMVKYTRTNVLQYVLIQIVYFLDLLLKVNTYIYEAKNLFYKLDFCRY